MAICTEKGIPFYYDGLLAKGTAPTLYHYTSMESARKILSGMNLRLSDPKRFNDMCDVKFQELCFSHFKDLSKVEEMWQRIRVLSMSHDVLLDGVIIYGYNHPRMWAQYAKNNTGVCLAIDLNTFLEENKLDAKWAKEVEYSCLPKKYTHRHDLTPENFQEIVEVDLAELLCSKSMDWRDEVETRIICPNPSKDYLSIKNSLSFVILGPKVLCKEYLQLIDIITDPQNESYKRLSEDSFVCSYAAGGNIIISDIKKYNIHKQKDEL